MWRIVLSFFFFQAEDGIRDVAVTGVQTCALPILTRCTPPGMCRTLSHAPSLVGWRPTGCQSVKSPASSTVAARSEEHTSELQSRLHLVCRLLLEKKKKNITSRNCCAIAPGRCSVG